MHFIYFLLPISVFGRAFRRPHHNGFPSNTATLPNLPFVPSVTSTASMFPSPSGEPVAPMFPFPNNQSALPSFPFPTYEPVEARGVSKKPASASAIPHQSHSDVPTISLGVVTYTIGDPISSQSSMAKASASATKSTEATTKTKPAKGTTTTKGTTEPTTKPTPETTTTKKAHKPTKTKGLDE
ncbi:hypothetical protein K449DRAFT_399500 [Hypoxylon sp. EC38]|nr:hypothetical protein K449DRAFT_399500 [Hypoxylon sp. EC38]